MLVKKNKLPDGTLSININSSKCRACGHSAHPSEKSHKTRLGLGNDRRGCGVVWTHVTSDYSGNEIQQRVREMRPDLIWLDEYTYKDDGKAEGTLVDDF